MTEGARATPGGGWSTVARLFRRAGSEWLEDDAPQLGAALAYYTVFSLAPLILVLLGIVGLIFRNDPADAWTRITAQLSNVLDASAVLLIQDIAKNASQPAKSTLAMASGIGLALWGASGVFGQLQHALNTAWGVKVKPGGGVLLFLRRRFLPFPNVAGI